MQLRFAFGCLALALAQGCIIIDDTDENGMAAVCETREDGACLAISASCPPDAVTLNVFTQPIDATEPFMDPFDCAAGGTVIVDPGTYDVRVEATNVEADVLFGAPAAMNNEVGDLDDVSLVFDFPVDKGFYFLTWTIEQDGSPLACDDIGAATVEVEATLTSEGASTTDVLPCLYGGWQTRALDPGDYEVVVSLLDDGGTVLGQTDVIPAELTADSALVALPDVTFEVAASAR